MKYQVVIQFPEALYSNLDWIADIEDRLDECLINAEVDGHDIGSGEVNIFIHSDDLMNTFQLAKNIFKEEGAVFEHIKIAYREIGTNDYICLWPEDLREFKVS